MPVKVRGEEEDSKQRKRRINIEVRWIKERESQTEKKKVLERRKEGSKGREMVGLWGGVARCHFKSEFTVRGDGL